jgi:hypothetical protein
MRAKDLIIGETLFTYNDKILEHKVIEKQTLETNNHTEIFWILECQTCADHTKCQFAIKRDDSGDLTYSHMINHYEEYDESERRQNSQYYWHKGAKFFKTRNEARIYVWEKNITFYQGKIEEAKRAIEYNEKCIEEAKEKIQAIKDATE